jgi:hypothetical protein
MSSERSRGHGPRPEACGNPLDFPGPALTSRRAWLQGLCALLAGVAAQDALAEPVEDTPVIGRPRGRPHVKLDRATLPAGLEDADELLRHVKYTLRRQAARADWGCGAGSTISIRFEVETLSVEQRGEVLHIRCSARGELPRRRAARSQLSYGGNVKNRKKLLLRVLEIVARGVVSRLADMERARRDR